MNLLVTLDSNYVHQLLVMLKSISHSNPCEKLTVYIIHTRLTEFDLALIKSSFPKYSFISIVLKSLKPLYNHDFGDRCFVGAGHTGSIVEWFNKKRLNMNGNSTYINAGVLMINVKNFRKIFNKSDIKALIDKKGKLLFQADQDIINSLYHKYTDYVHAIQYNLDEHTYQKYKINDRYIKENTVIIHFDGKNKPWKDSYTGSMREYYDYCEKILNNNEEKIQFPIAN